MEAMQKKYTAAVRLPGEVSGAAFSAWIRLAPPCTQEFVVIRHCHCALQLKKSIADLVPLQWGR